jgi:hypothetical protein
MDVLFGLEEKFEQNFIAINHWVSGLFPPFGILNTRKHDVSETGSVSVHW